MKSESQVCAVEALSMAYTIMHVGLTDDAGAKKRHHMPGTPFSLFEHVDTDTQIM